MITWMEIYDKKNDQGSIFLGKNERLGSGNQCDVPSWDLVMLIILKTSNHCRVLFWNQTGQIPSLVIM